MKLDCSRTDTDINNEIVQNVRDLIGPIASFYLCAPVQGLPRTRSGKTARKSLANLASGKKVIVSEKHNTLYFVKRICFKILFFRILHV